MLGVAPGAVAARAVAVLAIKRIARTDKARRQPRTLCRRTVADTVDSRGCGRGHRWREHATTAAQLRLEAAVAC